jgi:hypothetical protein
VRLHLLHAKHPTPVEQRIVGKDDGRDVPKEAQRKALPLSNERAVILAPAEVEWLQAESDRRSTYRRLRSASPQEECRSRCRTDETSSSLGCRPSPTAGAPRPRYIG